MFWKPVLPLSLFWVEVCGDRNVDMDVVSVWGYEEV